MQADQRDWVDYLGREEINGNVATHSATVEFPFVVDYGVDALQPTNLALEEAHSTLEFNQDGEELAKKREQILEMTKLLVEKTQKCFE